MRLKIAGYARRAAKMYDLILQFARKWAEIIDVRGPEDIPEMKADLDQIIEHARDIEKAEWHAEAMRWLECDNPKEGC